MRHHNRFGPEFSRFNSFNIKCLNNCLPTIDNLRKRQPDLYDSTWLCHFCGNHEETLEHMFRCASIDWSPITNNVINATNNLTQRLNINSNLDFNRILSTPTAIQNADLPSPIASLAAGYMPSYIFARLRTSGVLHHSTTVATNMIKTAVHSFRQFVWKERCRRQTDKEQQLGITKSMKRTYTGNSRRSQSLQTNIVTTTAYHAAKEKWKLATERGLTMMTQVIRLGSHGIDNGWAHYSNINRSLSKFL